MKEVTELKTKQFRIFAADTIPFPAINTDLGRQAIVKIFSFRDATLNPPLMEWTFEGGTLAKEEKQHIVIEQLQLNARRIVIDVSGSTDDANHVFSVIKESLTHPLFGSGSRWRDAKPVVATHETSCVASLDFDWSSLLNPVFLDFNKQTIATFSDEIAAAQIIGMALRFRINFNPLDERIKQNGVVLSDKTFTIEPRQEAPLSDRRYFTASPTDTVTHLELLTKFENMILGR